MHSQRPIDPAPDRSAPPSDAGDRPRPAAAGAGEPDAVGPPAGDASSVIGVSRLSERPYLSASAEALYRRIARTVELDAEQEFVIAPCVRGMTAQFLARVSGAAGSGVDPEPDMVEAAQERARRAGLADRLHFDVAELTDLPYQDEVFDFSMGEIGLGASGDPASAVHELVRVVKPMGTVVLLQLVWTRQLDPVRRETLVRQLGIRPLLLVEWKQMLRDAGVVDLHIEDLTDQAAAPRQPLLGVAGVTDFFHLRDRLGVLGRAFRRWGWSGVWETVLHGNEVRHLIERERVLSLSLIRGTRWRGRTSTEKPADGAGGGDPAPGDGAPDRQGR